LSKNFVVFTLLPVQLAKSQMEANEISAKIAANKPKMPFLRKPCFTGGGK